MLANCLATIIKPTGEQEPVTLPSGDVQRREALQKIGGGHIQLLSLDQNRYMVMHKEEKRASHLLNKTATILAKDCHAIHEPDYIAGTVVVLPCSKMR